MLEKLDSDAVDDDMLLMLETNDKTTAQQNLSGSGGASKDSQRDRTESRKRLASLMRASADGNAIRKPRWRLDMESENGAVSPFHEQDAEPMKQIQIFRSAGCAVLLVSHLRKLLRTKRLDQKGKAMRVSVSSQLFTEWES